MIGPGTQSIRARTILSFVGAFLPLFGILIATGFASYRLQFRAEEELAEKNESLLINFQATLISNQLNSVLEDVKFLVTPPRDVAQAMAGPVDEPIPEAVHTHFSEFLERTMNYASLAVFGPDGSELISISYDEGSIEMSRPEALGRIDSAYHLVHARRLEEGSVFVSRMDLAANRQPVIRFIAPMNLDVDEIRYLELEYDARKLMSMVRNAAHIAIGDTMLLNSAGYWLLSPHPEDEWGFKDPSRISRTFAVAHAEVWDEMIKADHGVARTRAGAYIYRTVYPMFDPHTGPRTADWSIVYDPGPYGEFAGASGGGVDLHWYLVSYVPHETILEQVASFRSRLMMVAGVMSAVLVLVSLLLALTRRRRMIAESLVEEEAAIFMNNPAPVIRLGSDGGIVKLNPAAVRIFDRATAGAKGGELFTAFDRERLDDHAENQPYQFEQRIGSRIYLFTAKSQLADGSCVLYGSDITGIKEIEREIRRLSTAVEQSATSILITDLEGTITFANEACARSSGYSVDELVGKHTRIFKSGLQSDDVYADLWRTIIAGEAWHGALRNRKRNGEIFWEEVSISPLRSDSEEVIGYLAVKEDITHRKAAEEQLRSAKEQAEAASKLKSEFLANMSHEIRTPMNAIIGFTDVLLEGEEPDRTRQNLEIIKRSGKHLLALINDILDFSRIEADKIQIESTAFAIRRVVEHLRNLISDSVGEKGLEFSVSIDPEVPAVVSGDEHRITQVLLNVLTNAVKFTDVGRIELACTYVQGELEISVSDTGIGIPADKMDAIFSAFEQVNSSAGRVHEGTGLGLAISKRLMELMGGRIGVESEVGRGSTFTIGFPAPAATVDPVELAEEVLEPDEPDPENRPVAVETPSDAGRGMVDRWYASMGNDSLLHGVLRKAIRDLPSKLEQLDAALASDDADGLLRVVHNIKGYSGNLGMQEIFELAKTFHDGLRAGTLRFAEADRYVEAIRRTVESIPSYHFGPAGTRTRPVEDRSSEATGLRMLTAEDNEPNRELIRVLLRAIGLTSDYVSNGQEVIDALERGRYDLLLLDMQMPIMDGLEALHEIRSRREWDDLYIIAVTAHAMSGDEARYLDDGCNDYMSKPIDHKAFKDRIAALRDRKSRSVE